MSNESLVQVQVVALEPLHKLPGEIVENFKYNRRSIVLCSDGALKCPGQRTNVNRKSHLVGVDIHQGGVSDNQGLKWHVIFILATGNHAIDCQ